MSKGRQEVTLCNRKGCKRESCISVNPEADEFLQFCLIHFYGTKFAQESFASRVFILNKQVYARQKNPTQQILHRVILEIKDEVEQTQGLIPTTAAPPPPPPQPLPKPSAEPKPPKSKAPTKRPNGRAAAASAPPARQHLWSIQPEKRPRPNAARVQPSDAPTVTVTGKEFLGLRGLRRDVPTDSRRCKVACMLKVVLDQSNGMENAANLALEIEAQVWRKSEEETMRDTKATSGEEEASKIADKHMKEYMKHARVLLKNLRDPMNGELRQKVATGKLTPADLASASGLELLNPDARKDRETAQRKIMIQRTKGSGVEAENAGAKSDDFVCPSCGNSKANLFLPLQVNNSHVAKTETWGNKESMDKNAFRVTCSNCQHVFIQT